MEKIKLKNGEIWVEGDILMIKLSGEITAEEIEEVAKISLDLNEKFKNVKYNVVDISDVRKAPLNARETAFNYSGGEMTEKQAFVCTNPVAKIIASFFIRRYKLPIPTKLFSNLEEAKKWFREGE